DPVGTRVTFDEETAPVEVIGVARDSKLIEVDESPIPLVYLAIEQRYTPQAALVVRAAGDPGALLGSVRRTAGEVAPTLPVLELLTASEGIDQALWAPRAGAKLLAVLGI